MATADKNVLPDPGRGAVVTQLPFINCVVPQVCRPDCSVIKESGGVVEMRALLIVT